MMTPVYWGYVGYGDTELSNAARLVKYAAEGGAPDDLIVTPSVGPYADLPAALGHGPYRNPLLDSPPWFDATNPDSAQFAGLLILAMTGVDGSTRKRSVTEGLGDGGKAGRSRAESRTIGVTAMAIAASDAALEAGLAWLSGVLHPPCAGAPETCGGAAVSLFSSAPSYCDQTPNETAEPLVFALIGSEVTKPGPTLAYHELADSYLSPVCGEVTVTATVHIADPEDGEDVFGRVVRLDLVDTSGTVAASSPVVNLPPDGSTVEVTVTYEPSPGFPGEWQPVLSWYGPAVLDGGDSTPETDAVDTIMDGGTEDEADDLLDGGDADGPWTTGPGYGGDLVIETWTYSHLPVLTAEECLADLRRSYRNVVTVDGPNVVEELTFSDGTPYAAKVEWTWVATDPVPYGDTTQLLRGLVVGRQTSSVNPSVRAASTANVSLFVAPSTAYYIDGIRYGSGIFPIYDGDRDTAGFGGSGPFIPPSRLDVEDRVLLKNQTDPAENGIYVYNGPGAYFTRATDLDTWTEAVPAEVYVSEGDTNHGTTWGTDIAGGGTINVTAMPWITVAPSGGAGYDDGVTFRAPGIQIGANAEVDGTDTACPVPSPTLVLCSDDPDLPPVLVPPAAPTLTDPGMPTVDTYVRRQFQLPPELSPQPGGVLSISIANLSDAPYRGIRVRLWVDDDPDFGVTDECGFEQEFYVSYLEDGQAVTIDGLNHRVTATCSTGLDADHERNMRGAYGGPFVFPEMRCGSRYHVAIDVPLTEDPGGVTVTMSVTRRGV